MLRIGRSYWLDRYARRPPAFPPLQGRLTADVAIVGAGVTGCAAALLFAQAGARVVVLEQRRIGRGSTAASTALLMQEPDTDYADLVQRYGAAKTRRIWRRSRAAVLAFRQTLADVSAPALHELPSLYLTHEREEAERLRREGQLRRRAGIPSHWVSKTAANALAGFETEAALRTDGNAQVDPYGACVALARAARESGAVIAEHSPVTTITGTRDGVRLTCGHGRVTADWAIIATGYATPAFRPLHARFKMMNTYVIATPRLRAAERRAVGLGDVMLWDTGRPYHYLRWTPDHRLLFGGRDRPRLPRARRPAALRQRAAELTGDLAGLYPSLTGMTPEYAWEGLFATTPDGLPYIGPHRRYPRQLFALGYGGNGMTFGYLAAELLVRMAQGRAMRDDQLFGFGRGRSETTRGIRD